MVTQPCEGLGCELVCKLKSVTLNRLERTLRSWPEVKLSGKINKLHFSYTGTVYLCRVIYQESVDVNRIIRRAINKIGDATFVYNYIYIFQEHEFRYHAFSLKTSNVAFL